MSRSGVMVSLQKWKGDDVKKRAEVLRDKSSYEIGLAVEAQAKLLCPVDTGRLRGSIQTVSYGGQRTKPKEGSDSIAQPTQPGETHVGTAVDYAIWVEYGTSKTDAQPFLRPANDIVRGRALDIVKKNGKLVFQGYAEF